MRIGDGRMRLAFKLLHIGKSNKSIIAVISDNNAFNLWQSLTFNLCLMCHRAYSCFLQCTFLLSGASCLQKRPYCCALNAAKPRVQNWRERFIFRSNFFFLPGSNVSQVTSLRLLRWQVPPVRACTAPSTSATNACCIRVCHRGRLDCLGFDPMSQIRLHHIPTRHI